MKHIALEKGLDIPISGQPSLAIREASPVSRVALVADDTAGMKPTMEVKEGDRVKTGQLLFTDKKNPGVRYTSPGAGRILALNRGAKRKLESLVIDLSGEEAVKFIDSPDRPVKDFSREYIRKLLVESGLWTAFRTRPYGKVPGIDTNPASLFITAMDSEPLAVPPELVISEYGQDYGKGLAILRNLVESPIYYCSSKRELLKVESGESFNFVSFSGPHPAGLPSTHIHFLDPVHEGKTVWHIGYQDVVAIGALFRTGELSTERIISLAGPGVVEPSLVKTRVGADLFELCQGELAEGPLRLVSGSALSGRTATELHGFLGRYHNQVTVLPDHSGRSLFNWAMPGSDRFSVKPVFTSARNAQLKLPMPTAIWGGKRAIYPLGTYEDVMPLDILPVYLLKALAVSDTEKSVNLGCLELIEEDLALCGFTCPGKNEFGPMLREVLTTIELGG